MADRAPNGSAGATTARSTRAREPAGGDSLVVAGVPLREGAVTPSRYDLAPAAIRASLGAPFARTTQSATWTCRSCLWWISVTISSLRRSTLR